VQRNGFHLSIEGRGRHAQRRHFFVGRCIARNFGPQHVARAHEAFRQQPVAAHLGGPGGVIEHTRIWRQADVGIDQRRAAEPARHQHIDVLADAHVEQRRRRAEASLRTVHLRLGAGTRHAIGKIAGKELAAALHHGDLLPAARQP